jgi:hypothetical protein
MADGFIVVFLGNKETIEKLNYSAMFYGTGQFYTSLFLLGNV